PKSGVAMGDDLGGGPGVAGTGVDGNASAIARCSTVSADVDRGAEIDAQQGFRASQIDQRAAGARSSATPSADGLSKHTVGAGSEGLNRAEVLDGNLASITARSAGSTDCDGGAEAEVDWRD
ncbi:MAG: hypothetical protein ACK56I_30250, partial [bacterium]